MIDRDFILKIIEDAKETDCVDFKRDFYTSLSVSDLAKDISAFANTLSNDDKYIVFGVEDKTCQIVGIDNCLLPDQDSLDQYLLNTIEPFVSVVIDSFEYLESIVVGYIKVLRKNSDRPYVIKRDCGRNNKIRQGDIYIRKGSIIQKASRADLIEMLKGRGTVSLRLRGDIITIEPVKIPNSVVEDLTYGQCSVEIYNSSAENILIDKGETVISANGITLRRRIPLVLPNTRIETDPLSIPTGSRNVYTCLFSFTSQDCVDLGFDTDGLMKDDATFQISLSDTDGKVYSSGVKKVSLIAKGDILHKVKLKNKNKVTKVMKRRLF